MYENKLIPFNKGVPVRVPLYIQSLQQAAKEKGALYIPLERGRVLLYPFELSSNPSNPNQVSVWGQVPHDNGRHQHLVEITGEVRDSRIEEPTITQR